MTVTRPIAELEALDPARLSGIIREHMSRVDPTIQVGPAQIAYVRHKPEVSTLVGFELELARDGERLEQYYTATHYAHRDEARRVLAKWQTRRPLPVRFGDPVFADATQQTVLCAFPNDAALAGLKIAVDPAKLRHVVDRVLLPEGEHARAKKLRIQRVTYKPERRFVARLVAGSREVATLARRSRTVYMRVYADQTGELCRAVSEQLAGRFDFVPRPLGHDLPTRIYFQEERAGPALAELLGTDRALQLAQDAGRKLRRLHTSGLELPRRIGPRDLIARLERTARDLADLDRELGAEAARQVSRLKEHAPGEGAACTVHGDFHHGQIVATEGGAVLLDFDEAGQGAPELDLGNFLAHGEARQRRHLGQDLGLDPVREHLLAGYDAPLPDLGWYRSAALILLAARPFRELAPDWRGQSAGLLDAASR